MRRRITFINKPESPFDAKQLEVDKNSLQVHSLEAAREERWTVNLYDLPQELWLALKQVHELHLRWVLVANQQPSTAPFLSAISPGLHVFVTPQKDRVADRLCPLVAKIFGGGLNCTLPEDVFTRTAITAERFASSASLQYYEYKPSVHNLVEYIQEKICRSQDEQTCRDTAGALTQANYIDLDYDTISQSLHLSAFWPAPPTSSLWNEQIIRPNGDAKVEIGVLASQTATKPEDISLGGYLITLGQDTKPNPTLFSFPSRHGTSSSNFTTSFTVPTGLHPTLRLTFPPFFSSPPFQSCALHTYLTLPSSLFPDKYQLSQPNLLKSNNLASLRSLSPAAPDLEAPIWTTREWGSALLLELSPPTTTTTTKQWHASVPLHLRYHHPSAPSSSSQPSSHQQHHRQRIPIPNPIVFWACPSPNHEGPEFSTNPFDRTNLGYDGLFGERTLFYHLSDVSDVAIGTGTGTGTGAMMMAAAKGVQVLEVPVLDVRGVVAGVKGVEWGTGVVVLFGVGWVLWCLLRVGMGVGIGPRSGDLGLGKGEEGKKER